MAFELNQFGIGMKVIEPGGVKTDFFTGSKRKFAFDLSSHEGWSLAPPGALAFQGHASR